MLLDELDSAKIGRDLAWAIHSPPLITSLPAELSAAAPHITLPAPDWFQQQPVPGEEVAEDIISRLESQKDFRLGRYFEVLVQTWLEWHPGYEVLEKNLKVKKDGRVLGEFDLIVLDKQREAIMHWELAVKFYLGEKDLSLWRNWHGPNRNDRFDRKLARLCQHQFPLAFSSEGRQLLESMGYHVNESLLMLKGRLFYPAGCQPGQWHWYAYPDFVSRYGQSGESWNILPKPHWLTTGSLPSLSSSDVMQEFLRSASRPMCLRNATSGEILFVVPDHWGDDENTD